MTTNVLWAGNVAGAPVVSIFSNPIGLEGNNYPVYNRFDAMDRIYLDSRFDYLNVRWSLDFSYKFNYISLGGESETLTTIAYHNFGYSPVTILLDTDTREIVSNNSYIQIAGAFYIKENYKNKDEELPSLTRRYTILAFNKSAAA